MFKTKNTFPRFEPFTIADFEIYERFVADLPQHCDFTLNNMLVWLAGDTFPEYSWLNDNMVLRARASLYQSGGRTDNEYWYTIIGKHHADTTLVEVFNNPSIERLLMVPDYFVEAISQTQKFIITEDGNNRDYILDIESLVRKSGKAYEDFRHQISYFLKTYSDEAVLRELDLSHPTAVTQITQSLQDWTINSFHVNGNDGGKDEMKAIERLLKLQSILPVKHQCLGLFIKGKLEGFSIYHVPNSRQRIGIGNHIKFNNEYKRLFDFLVYATANRLRAQGITLLNAEQDMGIEGIRRHKTVLNPVTFYKKYSILTLE